MAAGLAAAGLAVEVYTDAGVGAALGSSDALLLGVGVLAMGLAAYQLYRRNVTQASVILGIGALVMVVWASIDTVPGDFTSITPYVITLLVLAFASQRLRMPAADGQIYRKGSAG